MADEHSPRSYRSNETVARSGQARTSSQPAADPLAELARLIGQEDPFGDYGRDPSRRAAPVAEPASEWAAPAAESYQPQPPYHADSGGVPPQAASAHYQNEPEIPAYLMQRGAAQGYAQPQAYGDEAYAPQAYPGAPQLGPEDQDLYDDLPPQRRRLGVLAIAGVLALAVIGAAGAFGYRAVFGNGTRMPPPVIKADTAPSKIVPEKTAKDANKIITERVNGAGEKIVSREESPVDIQDKIATPAFPPPGAAGTQSASALPAVGSGVIDTEPHKVHTIVIRPDQSLAANAGPAASMPQAPQSPLAMPEPQPARAAPPLAPARAAAPAPRETTVRQETPRTAVHAANEPLSLNPNAAEPAHAARAPTRIANAAPTSLAAAPPANAARGGYAVQVTSQRSESEAKAAYRALQGKYGSVLGSQGMFVHKIELGAKGTYYRAMVGPFTAQAEAAKLCSSLKSAGGSCLVQRN
jgi:hypothetical protein